MILTSETILINFRLFLYAFKSSFCQLIKTNKFLLNTGSILLGLLFVDVEPSFNSIVLWYALIFNNLCMIN